MTAAKPPRRIDWRLVAPLMLHGLIVQTLTGMIRVTTSYRVLELDLPVVWLGAISAAFALLPMLMAVNVGRYLDLGHDARTARAGSALMLAAAFGLLFFAPTALMVLGFTTVLGVGHLFLMASQQMLCVRAAGDGDREAMFGNFLVANGIGQGLDPFIVGWAGGDAKVPETMPLFSISLAVAALALLISLALPAAKPVPIGAAAPARVAVADLLRIPGFVITLVASIITITAQDLIVIYLPLLGVERGIGVSHIGMILTVRSGAAIVSRLFYSRLIAAAGRVPLTLWSMCLSGAAYASLGALSSLPLLYAGSAALGLGLGLATTLSLTSILELAPAGARATALSLRITGNRIGQVSLPFLASIVAVAAGAPGVMTVVGGSLIAAALSVRAVRGGRG